MHFISTLTARRRFCGVMLFVWLFAVLSGTVNACVLAEQSPAQAIAHQRDVELQAHAAPQAHAPHPDHEGHDHAMGHEVKDGDAAQAAAHHHHDQVDEHASCHKFCKDESSTLPQNRFLDDQDFHPVLLHPHQHLLLDAPAQAPSTSMQARPPAHGPPLIIRFLRLAL